MTRGEARELIVSKAKSEGADLDRYCRAELASIFNDWVAKSKHATAKQLKSIPFLITATDLHNTPGVVDMYISLVYESLRYQKDVLFAQKYDSLLHVFEPRMINLAGRLNTQIDQNS